MPAAHGDATLLRQVFVNLIGNALKYSSRATTPCVEVGVEAKGSSVPAVYFVRDNGIGFDMAYVERLFRPFERLHSDRDFRGAGIGLALANLIVQRHGGRIWAEGVPGKGAVFRFTLGR
jgi:light-regulated signal transduction histidine kinase (bacteriophytochrome)